PVSLAVGDSGRAWERYKFSPDGRALLIATASSITIAMTDGSGARELDVGMAATEPSYRPPDGGEILFSGTGPTSRGLFSVDLSSGKIRQIVQPDPGHARAGASWPPDTARPADWTTGAHGPGPPAG